MYNKKYKKFRQFMILAEILFPLMCGAVTFFLVRSWLVSVILCCTASLGSLLAEMQRYIDRRYISDIVADLSDLCDNLIKLKESEVFPGNEENLLSKLQHKMMKLVKILKQKNEVSKQEQENIKGLVSDISHQLKTPIANLKMYVVFLEDTSISEEQRQEYIGIISLSVNRLIFLSESMIQISRLESGLIHLKPEMQSLNETVLTAIKNVFVKARNKGVEITYNSEEEIEICHDKRWTAEAIFNMLDNAVKYSPTGSVIAVNVRRLGLFSAVDIADMAQPISEEEHSKIFERFYRGKNSGKTEGIGIGLYLAREIAVKQNGYINLKCGENGNTFSIYIFNTNKTI